MVKYYDEKRKFYLRKVFNTPNIEWDDYNRFSMVKIEDFKTKYGRLYEELSLHDFRDVQVGSSLNAPEFDTYTREQINYGEKAPGKGLITSVEVSITPRRLGMHRNVLTREFFLYGLMYMCQYSNNKIKISDRTELATPICKILSTRGASFEIFLMFKKSVCIILTHSFDHF